MSEQLELFPQEELQSQGSVELKEVDQLPTIEDAEWCFQFFNNEPIVFAFAKEGEAPAPMVLQIEPKENEGLNFQQNGMTFRIFPRPISEKTKLEREKQNASQNKEA
jgi:hypothetical protein